MKIQRIYELEKLINPGRVLIIYGARRVGKTTLLNDFLSKTKLKYKLDSGDNIRIQHILGSQDFALIKEYASGYELLAIDEAQQIENIGMGLKILVDNMPNLSIIATGSSSFNLTQTIGEPLTGRKRELILYPVSQAELFKTKNKYELKENLEAYLIFGSYPEVITAKSKKEKISILEEMVNSYLLRDILTLENVKGSQLLLGLLKLLSFQAGSEVSINELAAKVMLNARTVARYLDLLEKGFVIKRVGGYSRNLRNEITTKAKYYFLDNGVRNAVISQFNDLKDRDDVGALFENFMFMERLKYKSPHSISGHMYFWRTHSGQEIDLVEDRDGKLFAYEFKWSEKRTFKTPKAWKQGYPGSEYRVIHKNNYLDFLLL